MFNKYISYCMVAVVLAAQAAFPAHAQSISPPQIDSFDVNARCDAAAELTVKSLEVRDPDHKGDFVVIDESGHPHLATREQAVANAKNDCLLAYKESRPYPPPMVTFVTPSEGTVKT